MKGNKARTVLITGGAGFIGSNLAERLLETPGTKVRIFDNQSRAGVARNVAWLKSKAQGNLEIIEGDVRNTDSVRAAVQDVTEIYHFAAQVAVTTSVDDPGSDFQVNAVGTFNVLEAARQSSLKPFVLYTSTNKVYGALESVPVVADGTRYQAKDELFRGVNEFQCLDFHSPYGCSKGTADQYVRDYARIYDLPTVVFRMSCIAGPRQFGNEDQGWVAHFLYSALTGKRITIYGDGLQVRDVLHVHDLVDAMVKVREQIATTRGQVFNVGGGPQRSFSVMEMLHAIEETTGKAVRLDHRAVRPGDQPLYISDTSKLELLTGWAPRRELSTILSDIREFWREGHQHADSPQLVGARTSALGEVA
ncbi:SDR family NAD(P)-dependent oxidoreductase [Occallatibacter savannae]|uniref:SDR family NAD(P)-dependent oxidoreductase n=1 Tax=Occallatibacter savannae TaxID=1002691 RepID=UPI000D6967F6|nr:SDR family NAD(P)-dependent oxidoreductase [Occallatibacter savannae]